MHLPCPGIGINSTHGGGGSGLGHTVTDMHILTLTQTSKSHHIQRILTTKWLALEPHSLHFTPRLSSVMHVSSMLQRVKCPSHLDLKVTTILLCLAGKCQIVHILYSDVNFGISVNLSFPPEKCSGSEARCSWEKKQQSSECAPHSIHLPRGCVLVRYRYSLKNTSGKGGGWHTRASQDAFMKKQDKIGGLCRRNKYFDLVFSSSFS